LSQRKKAESYFEKLCEKGAKIELKKIPEKRSLSQNKYLHALFTLWGDEFGYSTDEAKQVVKMSIGYVYEKSGFTFVAKTSEMNTKQLAEFIDKFRNWSSSQGCYLPSSDEMGLNWDYFAQQIERAEYAQKRYTY